MAVVEPVGCCKGSVCVPGVLWEQCPVPEGSGGRAGDGALGGCLEDGAPEVLSLCSRDCWARGQHEKPLRSSEGTARAAFGEQSLGSSLVLGTLHFAACVVQQSVASPLPSSPGSTLAFSS